MKIRDTIFILIIVLSVIGNAIMLVVSGCEKKEQTDYLDVDDTLIFVDDTINHEYFEINDTANFNIGNYKGYITAEVMYIQDAESVFCVNCENVRIIFDSLRTKLEYNYVEHDTGILNREIEFVIQ